MTETKVSSESLKAQIDTGRYVPSPEAIAASMLRRPGLRLLFGLSAVATAVGQSQSA
jgi:hypothetical protein